MENIDRRRDGEDDVIRRIKIDPPTFKGILDSKIFNDWKADLDYYFDLYRFTEESKVWFAKMRLSESAKISSTPTRSRPLNKQVN